MGRYFLEEMISVVFVCLDLWPPTTIDNFAVNPSQCLGGNHLAAEDVRDQIVLISLTVSRTEILLQIAVLAENDCIIMME